MKNRTPDIELGRYITKKRLERGWSRQQMSSKIGVTHQQLQKYEHGLNRISTGRLRLIANALGEPLESFFGDSGDDVERPRLTIELVRNFQKLNEETQVIIGNLVRSLADVKEDEK